MCASAHEHCPKYLYNRGFNALVVRVMSCVCDDAHKCCDGQLCVEQHAVNAA